MKPHELGKTIRELLGRPLSDADLRKELELLAQKEPNFSGFTWLWGPKLYARNRIFFRSLINAHFGSWHISDQGLFSTVNWSGETGVPLDAWLAEVDRLDDAGLFRRLYEWRLQSKSNVWRSKDWQIIASDLQRRLLEARTPATRATVLRKFDLWYTLEEKEALAIYEIDANATREYIMRRLPGVWTSDSRKLWQQLLDRATARKDEELRWKLYRRQVPLAQWRNDVLSLAKTVSEPDRLCEDLEKHHPEGRGMNLSDTYIDLAERRQRDVFPYLMRHLIDVRRSWFSFGRDGFGKMLNFAQKHEWWDLWAALVRTAGGPKDFDEAVAKLVDDRSLPEKEILGRLGLLAGVSREWNFGGFGMAQVKQITDETALKLYQRFPDVVRGPFKLHVQPNAWGAKYPKFLEAVLAKADEPLIDFLASRFVTRVSNRWSNAAAMVEEAERLSHYYEGMRSDEALFARRAAAVLGQIPAYSIWSYGSLLKDNRLARLLFERSARSYLADRRGISDLVEAPEIHVQALAYRALGSDLGEARKLAAENLSVLIGTLLRPLHRTTRCFAFGALANAANDLESARKIHTRAREALALPDSHYPKEHLVGLIAQLIHRWPELRSAAEQPVVYERAA